MMALLVLPGLQIVIFLVLIHLEIGSASMDFSFSNSETKVKK